MKRRCIESSSTTLIKFTLQGEKSRCEVREPKERPTVQGDGDLFPVLPEQIKLVASSIYYFLD